MSIDVVEAAPSTWDRTTLGEVCRRGGGFVQTGPFGSQLHASDYVAVGIPSVMPINLGSWRINSEGIARVTETDAVRLSRHRLSAGDIVFSRRGDVERHGLVTARQTGWLCGTGCLLVRHGAGMADPRYLSMWLRHPDVRAWLTGRAVGSTMPNLNTAIMSEVPVALPPLDEQRAIAEVLGALDDKIELNRQTNHTLEELASALFKSWFVDFDPVVAKAEGRDPVGVDAATVALFPSVLSNDGPLGWQSVALSSLMRGVKGRSYASKDLTESSRTALVSLKSFRRGGGYRRDGLKRYSGSYKPDQVVSPGEIVVALTDVTQQADVIGRAAIVESDEHTDTLVASLDVMIARPHPAVSRSYLYWLMRSSAYVDHVLGFTNGTTVLHLETRAFDLFFVPRPPPEILDAFSAIVDDWSELQVTLARESRTLAALRDTLLPKLLSGEIRLKQAEKAVEAAL